MSFIAITNTLFKNMKKFPMSDIKYEIYYQIQIVDLYADTIQTSMFE